MTIVAKNAIKEKIKGVKPNIEFAIIIWDAAFFIELQDVRQGVKIINKINLFIFNVIANALSSAAAVGGRLRRTVRAEKWLAMYLAD